jgi:hypothetical protein
LKIVPSHVGWGIFKVIPSHGINKSRSSHGILFSVPSHPTRSPGGLLPMLEKNRLPRSVLIKIRLTGDRYATMAIIQLQRPMGTNPFRLLLVSLRTLCGPNISSNGRCYLRWFAYDNFLVKVDYLYFEVFHTYLHCILHLSA